MGACDEDLKLLREQMATIEATARQLLKYEQSRKLSECQDT